MSSVEGSLSDMRCVISAEVDAERTGAFVTYYVDYIGWDDFDDALDIYPLTCID